jgi:hypothetical protein
MAAAEAGPHGGRGPRGVPVPRTIAEGLAFLQGRIDFDFRLPHLWPYVQALHHAGIEGAPIWQGEARNEVEALAMLKAIEQCCRAALSGPPLAAQPTDGADSQADTPKKNSRPVPENQKVLQLAKKIKRDSQRGTSKIDSAREFCDGDERKAKSLLRQLRRYPDLLK